MPKSNKTGKQKYTSAKTCVNQVPAAMKKVLWLRGDRNLDYGGGKYDTATRWLAERGVDNYVYDPFNRSKSHNIFVLQEMVRQRPDVCTLCNVLNVIKEKAVRLEVLWHIRSLLYNGSMLIVSCYRGRGNKGTKTCNGWQNNKPLGWYLPEIKEVFPDAEVCGSIIVASKSLY